LSFWAWIATIPVANGGRFPIRAPVAQHRRMIFAGRLGNH
jgi:hypothetical protein